MSDQDALLAAIIANPDEDTPRLAYADWLDENLPDKTPSPAAGPSARAEYIRVQCRLARFPFDDPDYPELLERERDLADWLSAHVLPDDRIPPDDRGDLPDAFDFYASFDSGDDARYVRGFPDEFEFSEFEDEPEENIETIMEALPEAFAVSTVRTLLLENAFGEEIVGIVSDPVAAGLRGLRLYDVDDNNEVIALRGLADSKHLTALRRLELDFAPSSDDLRELARANLHALEHLSLEAPTASALKALGLAKWFRNLRSLKMWMSTSNAFAALADLPAMPNLAVLRVAGGISPSQAALRRFAGSSSFPRLAHLELDDLRLNPEHIAILARAKWPLRHLKLDGTEVRKAGAEALSEAAFAESLRVLQLANCDITAGGAQALAASERLAGLRHLDLSGNPMGAGGLLALARSEHLRQLRALDVGSCNSSTAPLTAADVQRFLATLEMAELRHLRLAFNPVGIRGARVIAAGGPFANLTRLEAMDCGLREAGAKAIVESKALPYLAALDLMGNAAGKGVARLANPAVHPRLGSCDLSNNRLNSATIRRLLKRPGVEV